MKIEFDRYKGQIERQSIGEYINIRRQYDIAEQGRYVRTQTNSKLIFEGWKKDKFDFKHFLLLHRLGACLQSP